jgi:hypothetical protein
MCEGLRGALNFHLNSISNYLEEYVILQCLIHAGLIYRPTWLISVKNSNAIHQSHMYSSLFYSHTDKISMALAKSPTTG